MNSEMQGDPYGLCNSLVHVVSFMHLWKKPVGVC